MSDRLQLQRTWSTAIIALWLAAGVAAGQEISVRLESREFNHGVDFEDAQDFYATCAFLPGPGPALGTIPPGLRDVAHAEIADSPFRYLVVCRGTTAAGEDTVWCISHTHRFIRPCRTLRTGQDADSSVRYRVDVRYMLTNLSRQRVRIDVPMDLKIYPGGSTLAYRCADFRVGSATIGGVAYRIGLVRRYSGLTFRKGHTMSILIGRPGEHRFRLRAGVDAAGRYRPREAFSTDGPVMVGGSAYEIGAISPDGSRVVLQPSEQKESAEAGFQMPQLAFETIEGEELGIDQFHGKTVVLAWWHEASAECIAEMTGLSTLEKKFRGRDDVVFIGASPDDKESLNVFLRGHKTGVRIVQATRQARDLLGMAFPRNIVIDRNGTVFYDEYKAAAAGDGELEAAINACAAH